MFFTFFHLPCRVLFLVNCDMHIKFYIIISKLFILPFMILFVVL